MSRSDDTVVDVRRRGAKPNRDMLNMLRRMPVKLTSKPFWQAVGVLLLDGVTKETVEAENFSGIGFYARPAPGRNAEVVIANLGGAAENGVIIASRDEDTRKKMAVIEQNETAMFNTVASVVVKRNATVEVGTGAGLHEPTVLGQRHFAHVATLTGALKVAVAAISAYAVAIKPIADPINAVTPTFTGAMTALTTAITTFEGQLSGDLAQVLKVQ